MLRKFLLAMLATLAALGASPALADAITLDESDIGKSFELEFDGFADGTTIDGLTSKITLTLSRISNGGKLYVFDYKIENTSDGSTGTVTGFAFNVDPSIKSVASSGIFGSSEISGRYPNGIGAVDVCFKAKSGGSCAGAGSGTDGVQTGQTGFGNFQLGFSDVPGSITLSEFFVRYQAVNGDGSASGKVTTSTSTGGTPVPEPGMLGLFGFGLLGLGLMRRRRRTVP